MRKLKDVEYADCRKHNACDHRNNRGQEQADKQFVGILFTCFFVKDGILRKHAGAAGGGRAVSRKEGGDGNTADKGLFLFDNKRERAFKDAGFGNKIFHQIRLGGIFNV